MKINRRLNFFLLGDEIRISQLDKRRGAKGNVIRYINSCRHVDFSKLLNSIYKNNNKHYLLLELPELDKYKTLHHKNLIIHLKEKILVAIVLIVIKSIVDLFLP